MTTPDPGAVLDLWEIRSRGHYTVTFEWSDDPATPVAGYLTLTSPHHGHRLEAAVTWQQLQRFQREAARRLAGRSATADTGGMPWVPGSPPLYGED